MKIAVDVLSIKEDGSAGGASGFAIELIKGLTGRENIQVMILCGSWNIGLFRKIFPSKIQLYQVDSSKSKFGNIWRRIPCFTRKEGGILKKNNVDILFCPFSAATFRENGIPTVSVILDIQHEFYPQFFEKNELKHRRTFYENIVKTVERVVCISDYTKRTFCEKYNYPLENASTIYIAVQNRFHNEDISVLDEFDLKKNDYIVYPANFWEHKNHKLLLLAFGMFMKDRNNLKLVLTGNTLGQDAYYVDLLKRMKISSNVVITGYLSNEKLYSILKNSKGLIYPSLFEGFGIPVVEAMSMGKLIASSNLTSLPEVGCDSVFYFDPRKPDDILRGIHFLSETEMSGEILEEYKNKLQMFQSEKMVDEYIRIFYDVLKKKEKFAFNEEVLGIYPDGWSKEKVVVHLKNKRNGVLKIKISVPDFLKAGNSVELKSGKYVKKIKLKPGSSRTISVDVLEDIFETEIDVKKMWRPSLKLKSDDMRELGVMVNSISLDYSGKVVNLEELKEISI